MPWRRNASCLVVPVNVTITCPHVPADLVQRKKQRGGRREHREFKSTNEFDRVHASGALPCCVNSGGSTSRSNFYFTVTFGIKARRPQFSGSLEDG